jgi:hypothetical protein
LRNSIALAATSPGGAKVNSQGRQPRTHCQPLF